LSFAASLDRFASFTEIAALVSNPFAGCDAGAKDSRGDIEAVRRRLTPEHSPQSFSL